MGLEEPVLDRVNPSSRRHRAAPPHRVLRSHRVVVVRGPRCAMDRRLRASAPGYWSPMSFFSSSSNGGPGDGGAAAGAARGEEAWDGGPVDGAEVTRTADAPPAAVWAVLADGWLYANWVVGASRIRDVDASWPQSGARIHHSVGVWPALIDDSTRVLAAVTERELVLQARAWPAGEAVVRIVLEPESGGRTILRMTEDAAAGPGRVIPHPVRQALIVPRNRESLLRLCLLAQGRPDDLLDPARRRGELR